MDFIRRLGGVSDAEHDDTIEFQEDSGTALSRQGGLQVDGPIKIAEPIFGGDFEMLRDAVTTAVPEITIPSPGMSLPA